MMDRTRPFCLVVLIAVALAWGLVATSAWAETEDALWRAIKAPDHFAIMRHALAPGFGDPENFRLGDCSTQRNLDAVGRAQARRAGESFRAAGIRRARVYSSEWCRCVETAKLLGLGPVEKLPALNSLHARPEDREPNMTALRAFLSTVERDGPPVVLSTHQTVIRTLTGVGATSGEIVVFRFAPGATVTVVGTIRTDTAKP